VVAISRNPERSREELPSDVTLEACDTRNAQDVEAVFKAHAPVDILVNTATGGVRASGPFAEMDMDAFKGSFDKLWGYANTVRFGLPHMSEDASIVLVTGAPAKRSLTGQVALASVGGAIQAFVLRIAREIAPKRINVVSPGLIDTPMFGPDPALRKKALQPAVEQFLINRLGTPDEVAQAVEFLILNEYVTGTTIDVDGGWLLS
ncbi:MAG: SDR family oxidoreductase, partial [Gammaproteobacteria bacterium]|nr:SDR family oxidoreductase [Gammaproteobacteria bacterium]